MSKNTTLVSVFGSNLRKYRNKRGLSQRTLYALCGIDNATISRMENGQVNVSLNTLYLLADALDIQGWELLVKTEDESD